MDTLEKLEWLMKLYEVTLLLDRSARRYECRCFDASARSYVFYGDTKEQSIDAAYAAHIITFEKKNPHIGSTLDSLFDELGELDEVKKMTAERIAQMDKEK